MFHYGKAPDLVKPGVAIETPRIDDQGVPIPAGDGFSGISPVQILQRRVLAAINRIMRYIVCVAIKPPWPG